MNFKSLKYIYHEEEVSFFKLDLDKYTVRTIQKDSQKKLKTVPKVKNIISFVK